MQLKCYTWSVSNICRLYRHNKIDLEPPYQCRPAWRTRQREDLLESIFNGIPLPAVIVYRTRAGRRVEVFEVMDRKQRIESLLHFRYELDAQIPTIGLIAGSGWPTTRLS